MRKIKIIIIAMLLPAVLFAQENNEKIIVAPSTIEELDDDYINDEREYLNGMVPVATFEDKTPADTLHLPTLDYMGRVPGRRYMWYPHFGAFGGWQLHEGFNANVGVSAFTSFGKNAFSGWGQSLSAVYAKPINDKWTIAVGAYLNNYSTNHGAFRSAGITGIVSYRFNEHWEAYVYGQKAFMDNSMSFFNHYGPHGFNYPYYMHPLYDMGMMGDRIGAGVTWMPNKNFSVSVQFEYDSYPNSFHNRVQDRWEMPTQSPQGER